MSSLRPAPGQDAPVVHAVALDVAARAAGYAFAEKDDPRAAEGELGQFALRWVLAILQGMGALREPGEACELDQLERRLGIVPRYHRHFSALIRRLEDEGLVTLGSEDGKTVQATEQVRHYALESVEEQVAAFQASFPERHPACAGLMQFMVRCLSRFEEIVTGRIDAADVVFQDGNMDIFGEVFGGDVVSDYFNRLVAEAVRSRVARAGEGEKVRIVEIGAGTGRTTASILEAIQPFAESIEFWFTDISLSFVRYARRRFAEQYPWIDYRALNIEQDPAGQGFEAHGFDVVVAANVLHDTRDIEVTLEQTRRLLKPGGLLVLNEFTSPKDCLFFSGALLHGYWLFEDPERRQRDSCLLSVPQWGKVLARTGFTVVESFVLPTQNASATCSQSVILGVASGTVEKAAAGAEAGASAEKLAILGRCLEEDILTLLGEERASAYAARRPLMEMGLDSIELTELKFFVRERFGITLSPTFLFEHETQEKMTRALAALVSSERLPDLTSRPSQAPPQAPAREARREEEGIAIVGIACRFPGGATSPEAFWKLLERGDHGIVPMPAGRWQWPSFIDVAGKHKGIDQAGFLERIDELDARFFRISPKEAEFMDPQQRLLLELSWEALEDGGCRPSELAGRKIGVFVGACQSDYRDVLVAGSDAAEGYVGSGTAYAMLANRLSYFYDFKGPSLTVDTACSSSLFALHDAMNALKRGDCEQALVGAVNLLCSPTISISYYQAGMLSPTGRCRTFDETADGYVRGEGGAMLLLKPLALAIEHGDAIYGLVKGTAVNHGGQASTLTAPKPDAQADVIETAWRQAGATPDSVGYIEAHGTGTRLGDPIEISGLTEAFRRLYRAEGKSLPPKPHCGLGSVKSNVGHLEGAAGAAGLIKILLSMQHGQIPRTLNFGRLNPEIDLGGGPFYIVDRNQDWTPFRDEKGRELPRRASVSSFGFGGANAHAVLEEYRRPGAQAATGEDGPRLIPLSARSQDQLIERARQLLDFVERLGRPAGTNGRRAGASLDRVLDEIAGLLRARFDLGEEPAPDLEWEDLGWGPVETRLFLAALEETHGIRLHSRSLIEHPSLRSLAERIHREMRPGQDAEAAVPSGGVSLADVAYTLQVGREPMEERAAFVAASPEELASVLRRFVAGERGVPNCYCGYSRPLEGGERQAVETGFARRDLPALASLWVRGVEIDWQRLYPSGRPRRAHLPTYPFARERFWISRARSPRRVPPPSGKLRLEEYRFSSVLTGDEFFVADHVIQGRRLLPAVAYLEMAREAVESLSEGEDGGRDRICLKSFAWVRPLSVDRKPARVSLRLTPDGDGLGLEIYGGADDGSGSAVLHGQGRAETGPAAVAPVLDVEAWRTRCTKAHYAAEDCYRAFAALGYEYGPAQQGIAALHVGTDEILARLALPASLLETRDKFVLHPTMADAAVQATIGFSLAARRDPSETLQPALPFEVQSTEIFRACTPAMWAAVRRHDASRNGHGGGTFDIDLCDETGRLCARFQGLTLRSAGPGAASATAVAGETGVGEMILTPLWEPVEAGSEEAPRPSGRMAIVGGTDHQRAALREQEPEARPLELEPEDSIETMRQKIAAWGEVGHLVWIVPDHRPGSLGDEALLTAQRQGVYFGFRLIKALLGEGYGDRPLTWSVITTGTQAVQGDEIASPTHAGVHGLIGSMAKEYADWNVRLMDLPSAGDWPWSELLAIAGDPHGNASAWRDHRWYRQQLVPYRPAPETAAAYRPGGVYVVIGGAGGIGEVWSEALLRRMPVQLVWIGRRPKDAAIQATLDRLAGLGPAPLYISADATDREQLESARDTVKREFGRIDGVIHAAIVLQDRSLASLTEDELRTGLAPKIDVCVRMAQVFGGEALDFVLFFSSMLSFLKWPGQSNYVAGCTFKDAFAHRLAAEWPCRVRVINWGYWGSVGAAASERHRSLMARKGFGSIELPEAMAILDRLLAGQVRQLVYMKTTDPAAFDGVGIRLDQWAAHAEETLPSCIDGLRRARLVRAADEWRPAPAWSRTHQEIEEALCELLWAQLQSTPPGILDRYTRWLERSRVELEARGFLGRTADVEAVWQSWETRKGAWLRDADWQAQVQLAEVALRALPDVLTGRALATDVLLGDLFSAASLVSEVYRSGAVTRFCNQTLAGAVARYVEERRRQDPGCRIRILEIGAGTGGTTVSVFEALRAYEGCIEEYTFTDLSRAFLAVAKNALAVQPAYLKYETFDVEMPPAGQAIDTGGYDLVIATNVLHATRDIRKTLRNAKAVLKTNGLVLLNEISINSFFHHLTFGLLEGWWLFADPEFRAPGGPALRPETWKVVLEQEGLRSVFFPAEATHGWGQQVLVAESDGFLRQSVSRPAAPPQPVQEDVAAAEEAGSGPSPFAPFARDFDTSPAGIAEIMGQPREAAAGHLLAYLGLRVAETLSVDPATLDSRSRPFANALLGEFGMDSLSSNSLRNALRREIGVDIPVQRIIAEKVHHIVDELYEQLLLQHVSHDPSMESGEETETFVF